MNALLFPGQGSQVVAWVGILFEKFEIVKKIFKQADERLNFPISKIILKGPAEQLQLTKNTQPAIMLVSYSIFKVLKDEFGFDLSLVSFLAGHSLGEYSALVCSGSLDFNDALYLLHERGKAMQEAVPVGEGTMIAVLGLSIDKINNLIENRDEKEGICEIANDNAEGQVIISGNKKTIETLQISLKEKKLNLFL